MLPSGTDGMATVRVVTPEPDDGRSVKSAAASPPFSRSASTQFTTQAGSATSSTNRRQGMVFKDSYAGSYDSTSSNPASRPPASFRRPRTQTVDGARRLSRGHSLELRHRVDTVSSLAYTDENSTASHVVERHRPPDLPISTSTAASNSAVLGRERKSPTLGRTRLVRGISSQLASPHPLSMPSVDCLLLPVPTDDANRLLMLMKMLCGKMRGEAEYQKEAGGGWRGGMCYIDEEKGSLMFDVGDNGTTPVPIVADLRGCRLLPTYRALGQRSWLAIFPSQPGLDISLRPLLADEIHLWLAALLCWQQLPPLGRRPAALDGRSSGPASPAPRPEPKRRFSAPGPKEGTIIKVGKILLWDKGLASSPAGVVRRPSTRDLRSTHTCWRRVSCILRDNGEFKLMTENDVAVISVLELSQLSRAAIQPLDKSVLDEDFCIAILPTYSSSSTQLSIFRPVYIALDSRVLFEVWFVLLRAFTSPDVYRLDPAHENQLYELTDMDAQTPGETFRLEKTISVRVTEAKIRTTPSDSAQLERHGRGDRDRLVGNYLAEVILDGEVRARTTTKTETKTPFWREDCEFVDLPTNLPYLSVLLKRVDGNLESFDHQVQASLGLPKTGNLAEVVCGSVDITLQQLERSKDHEQWLPIYDDRQQTVGSMLIKVHHEELVVLLSKEYRPLSELLHRFGSGLTAQIIEALPGSLRRGAEILLNIFQVSNSATEWLMNMVEDEIDGYGHERSAAAKHTTRPNEPLKPSESANPSSDRDQIVRDRGKSLQGEANLLFRGNSLLTQALELHMRRLGKEYLEEVLADKIFEINELNPNCEVDPGKLQPGEDAQQHWQQLLHLTTEVWECISSSANSLPPELRHILKHIRSVAENRFGDVQRSVTYTSVSGFLFLRFVCPALLNPKLFSLLRDHPRPRAQRTLTLMAKGLQALANLSTIGKKETWMEPMNHFLGAQRQSFRDFVDVVCAIPVERTNVILPASYSTPITILGRLSPLAREGFPSLPYLIDHARNFAALVKLWTDANAPQGSETARVFEGDLLVFHDLCVGLQKRAADCFARVESIRLAYATSQANGEPSLGEHLDHVTMSDPLNPSSCSNLWVDHGPRTAASSETDLDVTTLLAKDMRFGGRDLSTLREVSGSIDSGTGATIRGLHPKKHARKLLSGFMRKRTASPASTATIATKPEHGQD